MASDDEVDYMSEEFLLNCVGNNDIRPGLSQSHATKRKYEIEKKKKKIDENYKKKLKPTKQLQEERLKEGMNTALDSSNKGFALMEKMGFKPGMSLGKGGGIVEPITVQLKSDRVGLGWQQLIKEKKKKIDQIRKEINKRKEEIIDPIKYRERMSNEHNQKKIAADLMKSRKVCYGLDTREGYTIPHEYWFWPSYTWEEEEEEEEENEDEEGQTLDNKESEKIESIPNELPEQKQESDIARISVEELDEVFAPAEQLNIISSYLRATYYYCLWCCTEYEDLDDLTTHCPGPTRSDHD